VGSYERHGYGRPERHHNNAPANSLLPAVVESGRGSPVLLGVIYLEVARRVGLRMHGAPLSEGACRPTERELERGREREREREKERGRERERERARETETKREGERERESARERQRDRERKRETERERARERGEREARPCCWA
jgi:hypothetical protein